jgi:hypothetical protein
MARIKLALRIATYLLGYVGFFGFFWALWVMTPA